MKIGYSDFPPPISLPHPRSPLHSPFLQPHWSRPPFSLSPAHAADLSTSPPVATQNHHLSRPRARVLQPLFLLPPAAATSSSPALQSPPALLPPSRLQRPTFLFQPYISPSPRISPVRSTMKPSDSPPDDSFVEDWCESGGGDDYDISEMGRENEKRQHYFHTIGYRDGLMAGKEASAQEGFNIGFKQSVTAGYKWGLIRGVTSAMSSLPEPLRNKLTGSQSSKYQLDKLHKSVQSISTDDALKMFYEKISTDAQEQSMDGSACHCSIIQPEAPKPDQLEGFARDLEVLLQECPEIKLDDVVTKVAKQG